MRAWIWKHSLSLTLAVGATICTALSAWVEHGSWWYDFWMNIGAGLGTTALLLICSRFLWEKDSDPATPPERNNGNR